MLESVVGCKWSLGVLDAIVDGIYRPGELRRSCNGISAKVLNERLRKLSRFGVIERVAFPEVPPHVEYRLTEFGHRFVPIVEAVRTLQRDLEGGDASSAGKAPSAAPEQPPGALPGPDDPTSGT